MNVIGGSSGGNGRMGVRPYAARGDNPFRTQRSKIGTLVFVGVLATILVISAIVSVTGGPDYWYMILWSGAGGHAAKTYHHKKHHSNTHMEAKRKLDKTRQEREWKEEEKRAAPARRIPAEYEQFPSVANAMKRSEIVVLYFAAHWCPDSTKPTKLLTQALDEISATASHRLLTQESLTGPVPASGKAADLAVIYISSDHKEEDMNRYGSKDHWVRVPFHEEERSQLKRHFYTCAANEAEPLGVERQHGIPHLVVMDGSTGNILTHEGVRDLEDHKGGLLPYWMELRDAARIVMSKFENDEDKPRPVLQ